MQTITDTYTVYDYDELSDSAKKQALDNLRDINTDYDQWHDPIIEHWTEELESYGYQDNKIFYSGFWSQGDGACFEATVNIKQWIKSHKKYNHFRFIYTYSDYINIVVRHSGHYYHENSMTVDIDCSLYGNNALDNSLCELEKLIDNECKELARDIYHALESYYEELQQDDMIIDAINSNGYTFLSDGTMKNY